MSKMELKKKIGGVGSLRKKSDYRLTLISSHFWG
jgi:hypothetical protein